MSFKDLDMTVVLRNLADRRIEEAMKEGKFDNLPGMGQPLELEDMPADEDARLAWWCIRILRNNDFTPEEIRWRKQLDFLRDDVDRSADEGKLRKLVSQYDLLVHKVNTLGTNAMRSGVAPLSIEHELGKLRVRLG